MSERMARPILLYFGSLEKKGHFLYGANSTMTVDRHAAARMIPSAAPGLFEMLDGTFCYHGKDEYQIEGKYMESIVWPLRIVAWWDRSLDGRHNSNSVLIGYGYNHAEKMLDDAIIQFPIVMSRQPRPLPQFNVYPKWSKRDEI